MKTANAQIIVGDSRLELPKMEADSVDCCVTSPPYWGLRDYGVDGQIGLEASVELWVADMVKVFEEVRRVLKPKGTLWLNLGDSYNAGGRGGQIGARSGLQGSLASQEASQIKRYVRKDSPGSNVRGWNQEAGTGGGRVVCASLKAKDLIGQPWRVAFALQAAGWYLRAEIIWHKPNPMPESCKDRPTRAHEQVFLCSKSPRYFYDAEAIEEACSPNTNMRVSQNVAAQIGSARAHAGKKANGNMKAVVKRPDGWTGHPGAHGSIHRDGREIFPSAPKARGVDPGNHRNRPKQNASFNAAVSLSVAKRNARSVWTIAPEPYKGDHFATFPTALVDRCIRAGCPVGGLVLDPFLGTGTTIEVALKHGRRGIGIELNPKYARAAVKRLSERAGLFL